MNIADNTAPAEPKIMPSRLAATVLRSLLYGLALAYLVTELLGVFCAYGNSLDNMFQLFSLKNWFFNALCMGTLTLSTLLAKSITEANTAYSRGGATQADIWMTRIMAGVFLLLLGIVLAVGGMFIASI